MKLENKTLSTTPSPKRRPFTPPKIVWREPYEPVSFGLSCARFPGQGGCAPQKQ
jgi:hypothetical protein